ncbi:FG-GAP repeat protein [Phytomonospora endophytica]|uniref:Uncharacterized protein n=1 Tax=Phytomonospora endophytica TaxID=714109 RepID=A0A841FLU2_9ACTN|nr:FG-GAP repeat protein [Phytomonospora endophytica]MBB6038291.1 hypothetical protein [Phytomonospora endophytica]
MNKLLLAAALAGAALTVVQPATPAAAQDYVRDEAYDLDCNGTRDVVLADEWATVGGKTYAGAFAVTYADIGGGRRTSTYSQDTAGMPDLSEYNDHFGAAHASLDWNRDGCDDLVVGAPGESIGSTGGAGMIWVIPGAPGGLNPAGAIALQQNSPDVPEVREEGDAFGAALAASVTSDGVPYLLVSAPGESIGSVEDAGAVWYWRAGAWDFISQNSTGVAGTAETRDGFGATLAVTDRYFAVGTPDEGIGWNDMAGMVHVFSNTFRAGAPTPLAGFSQDTPGISGGPETYDQFGSSLSVISYRPSASASIGALVAVGVPYEHIGDADTSFEGIAHLVQVTNGGKVTQVTAVNQATAGVPGSVEQWDEFGGDVIVAIMGDGKFGTPSTVRWVASADSGWHVFLPTKTPGTGDLRFERADPGLPAYNVGGAYGASREYLYLEEWVGAPAYAVPWSDILAGRQLTYTAIGPIMWPWPH